MNKSPDQIQIILIVNLCKVLHDRHSDGREAEGSGTGCRIGAYTCDRTPTRISVFAHNSTSPSDVPKT